MHKEHKGFTLIELLIVIAIIGILASVVLVSLAPARDKAKSTRAKQELAGIRTAMEVMALDTDEWPGHQTPNAVNLSGSSNEIADIAVASAGLAATDGSYSGWRGPYITSDMIDPWGNPYFLDTDYDLNGGVGPVSYGVALGSYGPNGVGLNLYDSDDVIVLLPLD